MNVEKSSEIGLLYLPPVRLASSHFIRYQRSIGSAVLLRACFSVVYAAAILPPLFGFFSAFGVGLLADYAQLFYYEWTCGKQFLPSVSRVINLPTERIIWHVTVLFHIPFRLIILLLNYRNILRRILKRKHRHNSHYSDFEFLIRYGIAFMGVSATVECALLAALTVIGERENGNFHVALFVAFLLTCGMHFMLLTYFTESKTAQTPRNEYDRNDLTHHNSTSFPATSLCISFSDDLSRITLNFASFSTSYLHEETLKNFPLLSASTSSSSSGTASPNSTSLLTSHLSSISSTMSCIKMASGLSSSPTTSTSFSPSTRTSRATSASRCSKSLFHASFRCKFTSFFSIFTSRLNLQCLKLVPFKYRTLASWNQQKLRLAITVVTFVLAAIITIAFILNYRYCTPHAYTVFACAEYATVFSIFAFNATVIMDLRKFEFVIVKMPKKI